MEDGALPTNVSAKTTNVKQSLSLQTPTNAEKGTETFTALEVPLPRSDTLFSPIVPGELPFTHKPVKRRASIEFNDYFHGPRDLSKHSKWPLFLQLQGSILPKMIVPLSVIACWSTVITVIHQRVHPIGIQSVLLTVLGFLVGMGLSFRSSTAYERYSEGRKAWAQLIQTCQNLGRVIWIHGKDAPNADPRESLLRKITSMNLVVAFSISLKHDLRFEPYSGYDDLKYLVGHLNTFAADATALAPEKCLPPRKNAFKEVGEYLGISFAASNPRKILKKADQPLGHLPLEILSHIAVMIDEMVTNEQLTIPMTQTLAYNNLNALNEVLTHCERILNTPLPIAYGIAISQITWVYAIVLPFQLVSILGWVTIPASVVASYVLLGLHLIGREIENPFGEDVNDLPLDQYCEQIARDMDTIASYDKRNPTYFMKNSENLPLYPVSAASASIWMTRDEDRLRNAIHNKPHKLFGLRTGKTFHSISHQNTDQMA